LPGSVNARPAATLGNPPSGATAYPSEPMTVWPISTRVNKLENDDATILESAVTTREQSLLQNR